jgi:uncharacterized protein YndB with AHSA1/START domain
MNDTQRIKPAPVRKELRVRAGRERAFETFAKMGAWWMKAHSVIAPLQKTEQADVVIEPRAGGRWYEVGSNGNEYDWGKVIVWDPPRRLVLCWQLGASFEYDPELETTVEVLFVEDGEFTNVSFEHRDLERFGEGAGPLRESMDGGWGELLEGFRKALEG